MFEDFYEWMCDKFSDGEVSGDFPDDLWEGSDEFWDDDEEVGEGSEW
jgi:hypothetical protein